MTADRATWETRELERDGIRVEVVAQSAVNLALAHNEVPVVRLVRVVNLAEHEQVDLQATLTLRGQGQVLAGPLVVGADGPVGPGEQRIWDNFAAFAPDHAHLAGLDESHAAVLTIAVSRAWGEAVTLDAPVRVLAHNEWFNASLYYESLAAFVQPNTEPVATVLGEAAEVLREHTGDASLAGYQEGPERASLIAAAIYEALRRRGIRYVEPPASFEDSGQKVRTTSQVLRERLGTCIDLTVVYAAALEQAGLHPLVWLVDGHAFGGYLRDAITLGQTVVTEPNAIINLVESGRAVPVEATYYKAGEEGAFAGAVDAARRRFGDPDSLRGLIDVRAARRAGTRPLPSTDTIVPTPTPTPTPAVAAPVPSIHNALTLPPELRRRSEDDDVLLDVADDAPMRVRQWKRALLD